MKLFRIFLLLVILAGTLHGQGDQFSHQKQQMQLYLRQSDYPKALAMGLDLVQTTTKSSPTSDPRISEAMQLLGSAFTAAGQYAESEMWLRRSLSHINQYQGKQAPAAAVVYRSLATNAIRSGDLAAAPEFFDLSIELLESAAPELQLELAEAFSERANMHFYQEDWDAAEKDFQAAMKIQEAELGFQSPQLARSLNNIGGVYMRQGSFQKAKAVYQHAYNMQKATLGAEAPEIATTLVNLAVYFDQMAEFEQAESYLKQALDLRNRIHGPSHPLVGAVIDNLISLYLSLEEENKAWVLLTDLKKSRTQMHGGNHPLVADVLDKQAAFALTRERGMEAEAFLNEALVIRENHYGPRHDRVAATLYNLGKLQNLNRKPEAARLTLTQALDIYEYQPTGNQAALCGILAELVATDLAQSQHDLAEDHLLTILKIKELAFGPEHPEVLGVHQELLRFYQKTEQRDKASETQQTITNLR